MTHINAFYADVDRCKQELEVAKANLEAAEIALKSHEDYTEEVETTEESSDEPTEEKPKKEKKWLKKK